MYHGSIIFLVVMMKYIMKETLKMISFLPQFERTQSAMVKSQWQEFKGIGHTAPTVRKQSDKCWCSPHFFFSA